MKNWRITSRLVFLVLISLLTFVGMGLYGIYNTRAIFTLVKGVNDTAQDFQRGAQEISNPLQRTRELSLSIVLAPDRALQGKLIAAQEETSQQLDKTMKTWTLRGDDATERIAFGKLQAALLEYGKIKEFTIDRVVKGYREEAFINAIGAGSTQFDLVTARLDAWQKAKIDGAGTIYRQANATFDRVFRTSILVIIAIALLVGGLAVFIMRTITEPIRILTTTASLIADKVDDTRADQALTPVLTNRDEVGQLARGFNHMVRTLRAAIETEKQSRARIDAILNNTRSAVGQLGATSAQLLASTREQAAGSEGQAAAVAQIVTTVNEVTQTADRAAARAKGVGRIVLRTVEISKAGRQAVEDSVSALNGVRQQVERNTRNMMALVQQTKAIADIIATVDDIAQQSHVLAVNAAIEAAKADTGGKEFTVIASEIKAMAEQSRQGTAQVRQILNQILTASRAAVESMEGVTQGVSGAISVGEQSSETINELAVALLEVAETSAQTVASAEQEALGLGQISNAMKNIDQAARQALLAIQRTAEAAAQLNDLGSKLTQLNSAYGTSPR